jgi:hypothetical protein
MHARERKRAQLELGPDLAKHAGDDLPDALVGDAEPVGGHAGRHSLGVVVDDPPLAGRELGERVSDGLRGE